LLFQKYHIPFAIIQLVEEENDQGNAINMSLLQIPDK
jgi:hypothetical protein